MSSRLGTLAIAVVACAGCYTTEPLDLTCNALPSDGGIIPTDGGVEPGDASSDGPTTEPFDACDVEQEGSITNMLDGTCFWEQCREGEKSLFRKPPGVPCVYRPGPGSEWTIGACKDDGACSAQVIGEPK